VTGRPGRALSLRAYWDSLLSPLSVAKRSAGPLHYEVTTIRDFMGSLVMDDAAEDVRIVVELRRRSPLI